MPSTIAPKSFRISASANRVYLQGDLNQELWLLADSVLRNLLTHPTARCLDLLNIAAGVYAVDRAVKRKPCPGNDRGIRSLGLCFEVHDLAFWQRADITEAVTEILCFLSDENWAFCFEQARSPLPSNDTQLRLNLPWVNPPRRIALYSGGLDSAAGLANRVLAGASDYLLVTVGHQSGLRRRCADQIRHLSNLTKTATLPHTTLVVALRDGVAKRMSHQERSQRSRAFLFCAAASAVAQACGIDDIEVFENGVGAINLPLMAGMLSGGLATRGAHPTFLSLMGDLVSSVMEKPMRFSLPFTQVTKAEMLVPLASHNLGMWAQSSRSCVHTSWRERKVTHCGQCPGCIERRQAFAAAGIHEQVRGCYSHDLMTSTTLAGDNADYFRRYLDDASAWLAGDESVQRRLAWHLGLTKTPDVQHREIAERLHRHAQEAIHIFGHLSAQSTGKAPARRRAKTTAITLETGS